MMLALTTPAGSLFVEVLTHDPLVRYGLAALLAEAGAQVRDDDGTVAPDVTLIAGVLADDGTPTVALVADDGEARQARRAGALGVLSRDVASGALVAALAAVTEGLRVDDGAFLDHALPVALDLADALTRRETEVLALLAEGLPNKLVADRLGITERTARYHVAQILAKLGAQSRTEAVVTGARLGLVAL